MEADEVAAIVVAAVSAVALLLLVVAWVSFNRTLRAIRETLEEMRLQALPTVNDVRQTVRQANAELERVDGLLVTAESISATVDSASRLAYLAFSNPVIKVLAFGSGTQRAVRRFRRSQ